MRNVFFPLLFAPLLAACGPSANTTDTAAPDRSLQLLQVATPEPVAEKAEPQVGDRIEDAGATRQEAGSENDLTSQPIEYTPDGVRILGWEELMPAGEEERLVQLYQQQMTLLYSAGPIAEGSAGDVAVQIGTFNTVAELNGQRVRLPGYTVPFEYSAEANVSEFLLVPYFGACIHAPAPPPNQTIFVVTDKPLKLKDLAQAVWIEGTIHTQTQESDLADAAYTFKLDSIETYEY